MIKNIIFDVGNVLFEYRWEYSLEMYGIKDQAERRRIGRTLFEDGMWQQLDLGNYTEEEGMEYFAKKYPADAGAIRFFFQNLELLQVDRPKVWEKLPKLKEKGYRMYLLSNYSEGLFSAHIRHMTTRDCLDGGVISWQVHKVKPDPEIYKCLLEKYDLKARECIFFDDREENIKAAQDLGFAGTVISSQDVLLECLDRLLEEPV